MVEDSMYTQPHFHSPSTTHMGDCSVCGHQPNDGMHAIPDTIIRHLMQTTRPSWQLYLDCDDVMADFTNYFKAEFGVWPREYEYGNGSDEFWQTMKDHKGFYRHMPLMHDAMELFNAVKHLRPIILTGYPKNGADWAIHQKILWAEEKFNGIVMMPCLSEHKYLFCRPGDVLIDDWGKYRPLWEGAGGSFIRHASAKDSLEKLHAIRHF